MRGTGVRGRRRAAEAAGALPDAVGTADAAFRRAGEALLAAVAPPDEAGVHEPVVTKAIDRMLTAMDNAHQPLKAALLAAGADGRMTLATMDDRLRAASASRRALQQAVKAARLDADIAAETPAAG